MNLILKTALILTLSICLSAQKQNVTILYTNDIESVYEPIDAFWNDSIEQIGGTAHLATLIKEYRTKSGTCFLFDAGDIFTGALSEATKGALPFDIYSSMGYDAICIGNHEFEYGWEELNWVKQRARFPVLNCNIFYEGTDIPYARSYVILEREGLRVGVIGLMGIEAFHNTINNAHSHGLEIRDPYPIVQHIINEIQDEVDLTVVLTHQNLSSPMQTDKENDPDVQRGFDEDYALAGAVEGIDIVIGGHSDNGLWEPVKHPNTGTLVCMTFGQSKYLGYLSLRRDTTSETPKWSANVGKLIPVQSKKLIPDSAVQSLINNTRKLNPELTEVIGFIDKPAYRKYYKESFLGNLIADALRKHSGADIGVVNPGSIRADLNKGEITMEEIANIYPFVDGYKTLELSGKVLAEFLEYSCSMNYGLAQLSGISTIYDPRLPIGHRVTDALIGGEPLDSSKNYTLVCSSFLANGGDGYSMLKTAKEVGSSDELIMDCLANYIRENKSIKRPALGRQKRAQ